MNAYYTNTHIGRFTQTDSDTIRKAYLASMRKQSILKLFSFVDAKFIKNSILALKIISAIVCAVSFFAVVGMIENGSISMISGIICTLFIAALECLCFIPASAYSNSKK